MAVSASIAKFGFPTRLVPNPVVTTVGTTIVEVMRNNPDRIFWLIENRSANDIYLGFKNDVSSTNGVRLAAAGGSASMTIEEDGNVTGWQVFAVATGAGSSIYSFEIEKSHDYQQPAQGRQVT
jgi:hypothetical protein